jgi:hypothetical protein
LNWSAIVSQPSGLNASSVPSRFHCTKSWMVCSKARSACGLPALRAASICVVTRLEKPPTTLTVMPGKRCSNFLARAT